MTRSAIEAGTSTPRSEAIASIQATGADGVVSGGIVDDAVKAVLLHRIARSGMRFAGFQQNSSGNWIMQFDSETSLSTIMRSAQVLAAPTTGGLRRIVAVEGNGAGAGAAFGTSTPISPDVANTFASTSCEKTLFGPVRIAQDLDVACSPDLREKYLLGETVVPAGDITSVQPGRDSLRILLNPDGARHLSDFSSAAFQEQVPDDQLAVAAGGEVLVAPALSATITNGILDINGNLTPDQIELVDSQLTLMTSGVHFTVVSAHAAK